MFDLLPRGGPIEVPPRGLLIYTIYYSSGIKYISTSTKGIKRLSKKERINIELSDKTTKVLVGILLGDGHIQRRSVTANSRFIFAQTVKHSEYYHYVYDIFKPYCTIDIESYHKIWTDERSNQTYQSLSFATIAFPPKVGMPPVGSALYCFNNFREIFYLELPSSGSSSPRGKKMEKSCTR